VHTKPLIVAGTVKTNWTWKDLQRLASSRLKVSSRCIIYCWVKPATPAGAWTASTKSLAGMVYHGLKCLVFTTWLEESRICFLSILAIAYTNKTESQVPIQWLIFSKCNCPSASQAIGTVFFIWRKAKLNKILHHWKKLTIKKGSATLIITRGHDNTGNLKILLDIHVPYGVDTPKEILYGASIILVWYKILLRTIDFHPKRIIYEAWVIRVL